MAHLSEVARQQLAPAAGAALVSTPKRRRGASSEGSKGGVATVSEVRKRKQPRVLLTPKTEAPVRTTAALVAQHPVDYSSDCIELPIPDGFSLAQSICSYGYFSLAPNR